jgi:hypothetical protein
MPGGVLALARDDRSSGSDAAVLVLFDGFRSASLVRSLEGAGSRCADRRDGAVEGREVTNAQE